MTALDAVELPILWQRLIHIADECWTTIWHASFSTVIGEALDFGVEILDSHGESLAHADRSMPVFHFCLPHTVKEILSRFPGDSLKPGDVLITNDPWLCAGHLPDVAIITPVFYRESLVAIMASVGNVADIGGTKNNSAARELYEEGLLLPPMYLHRGGNPVPEVLDIIAANVRVPEMVLGDIDALIAANRVGEERLISFLEEYRLDDFEALAEEVKNRAEFAMRAAIKETPEGVYTAEVETDRLMSPAEPLRVTIEIRRDSIKVDYTPAPPEAAFGGINCPREYTVAHTLYALKLLLTPDIPSNSGNFRPIDVLIPEGTILAARRPASVALRVRTGWHIHELIYKALVTALPGMVQAGSGLASLVVASGRWANRTFDDSLFLAGGQGASRESDGTSSLLFPTSAGNVSIEMFENRTPLIVEEKAYVVDSGGRGKHRGGLGERVVLRMSSKAGTEVSVAIGAFPEGLRKAPSGLEGGEQGSKAALILNDERLEEGKLVQLNSLADRLVIEMPGGGGWGDMRQRAADAEAKDIFQGLVSEGVQPSNEGRDEDSDTR
jgi:5-oxoprolinase (ATP-hydrolysing)